MERMAGAHVHLVTKEEYTRVGSVALGEKLEEQLRAHVCSEIRRVLMLPRCCPLRLRGSPCQVQFTIACHGCWCCSD